MSFAASLSRPLHVARFRGLWGAGAMFFIGNAMHTTAASWLVVELTGSSFLAALVQTAMFLPMFLLSLPAGVLADTSDRRRLITNSQLVYSSTALLLALMAVAGWAGPAVLLVFTFVMGSCTALQSPAWNSAISESVDRSELPQAITLVAMAFNAARALGPTVAGLVFALAGSSVVFGLSVASSLFMLHAMHRWPPAAHAPGKLPPERLWRGMLAALRFSRHSEPMFAQLVRTIAFSSAGSALWALLPIVAQRRLGLGAAGFGVLMGCLGIGAVGAGFFVAQVRATLGLDRLAGVFTVVFSAAMLVAAYSPWPATVYLSLIGAGAAWMAVMSTLNAATQTSAPLWMRARATSMHTLCALGSFAIGSAIWGAVSGVVGLTAALALAAGLLLASSVLVRWFPLRMGNKDEVTPATPWHNLFVAEEPDPEAGPVAVEIAYRIEAGEAPAFLDAASQLRGWRRRDGATLWRIYRDLADPSRYVERFIVPSWADYLRQREHATLADRELESRVREFQRPGEPIAVQHYIAER